MRIAIIADRYGGEQGGNSKVMSHIASGLADHDVHMIYILPDRYLPSYLRKWEHLFRVWYLHKVSKTDVSSFDMIITLQPDSHCIRHSNHIIYFQHHLKQYYDLYRQTLLSKKGFRKKIIFMVLTLIARIADKIYLTPNLKKSHVIVNGEVVGRRIAQYNGVSNFAVINPGCDLPQINTSRPMKKQINDSHIALSFSRLNVVQKGIDLILESAPLIPSCQFIIAGPPDRTVVDIDRSHIAANVQILDRNFSEDEKANLFVNCDIFLAPYVEEDFGIAPIEANGYGKPVVYCDDGGGIVFTQKHKETGFMCKRKPRDFADGIRYCIENAQKIRSKCIINSTKYSWNIFENTFAAYVEERLREKNLKS